MFAKLESLERKYEELERQLSDPEIIADQARFRTLAKLCAVLQCAPGELLDYDHDPGDLRLSDEA